MISRRKKTSTQLISKEVTHARKGNDELRLETKTGNSCVWHLSNIKRSTPKVREILMIIEIYIVFQINLTGYQRSKVNASV